MDRRNDNVQRACQEGSTADPCDFVQDGLSMMAGYREGVLRQLADLEDATIKTLDAIKLDAVQKIGQVRSQFDDYCDAEKANLLAMAGEYREKKAKLRDASAMLEKLANLTVSLNDALTASPPAIDA